MYYIYISLSLSPVSYIVSVQAVVLYIHSFTVLLNIIRRRKLLSSSAMNPLKSMYSSGIQKGAEESRKLRFLLSVLLPSICSLRCKPQVLIFLQLQMFVENADTAEEEADRLAIVHFAPMCRQLPSRK
jgi:hypothetical protein